MKVVEIPENAPKPWWPGDKRVEQFMHPVREVLQRREIENEASVDIYNRAYEAVYAAILKYDGDT